MNLINYLHSLYKKHGVEETTSQGQKAFGGRNFVTSELDPDVTGYFGFEVFVQEFLTVGELLWQLHFVGR